MLKIDLRHMNDPLVQISNIPNLIQTFLVHFRES